MDHDGRIKPGHDFLARLLDQVASCDVLLAVIGSRWAALMAERSPMIGAPSIFQDESDVVVAEIAAALSGGKQVIPVLVGFAAMPKAGTLPLSIRELARRQAITLQPDRFASDCQLLVSRLRATLADADGEAIERDTRKNKVGTVIRADGEWTTDDNGKDIKWTNATDYARQLKVDGFSDWRLPTIDELEALAAREIGRVGLIIHDIQK